MSFGGRQGDCVCRFACCLDGVAFPRDERCFPQTIKETRRLFVPSLFRYEGKSAANAAAANISVANAASHFLFVFMSEIFFDLARSVYLSAARMVRGRLL